MKYTSKQYYIEEVLRQKLDFVVERAAMKRKLDAIFICDGDEGFGKTGMSILCMYYLSEMTGREFNLDHVFFDPEEFIKFVNSTREQLIIWDEAALGGLANNWQSRVQQMLIQTLMTCRSRKHIIIFNVPKFYRLNLYFVVERAVGLIHVYSRDNLNAGHFTYYTKKYLEGMMDCWAKKRKKPYKLFPHLRGTFPDAFKHDIIDEDEYDKKKDASTQKLIDKYAKRTPSNISSNKLLKFQYLISQLSETFKLNAQELAEFMEVNNSTLSKWKNIKKEKPKLFE